MKKIVIKRLSVKEVNKAINEVKKYEQDLNAKCERFALALADLGLKTSQAVVSRHKHGTGETLGSLRIVTNKTGVITSVSVVCDSEAILFLEFGSGFKYNDTNDHPKASELGMGAGTYPGQTHANDPNGWWYKGDDGEWHHSFGLKADMPMYKGWQEMFTQCQAIASKVFRGR